MASTTATPKTNREGLAALDEALQAGAATLQRLEEQGEQLHQTEIVADSNKYLLDRSAREIRGMTWSGWLQNQFTSGPAVPPDGIGTWRFSTGATSALAGAGGGFGTAGPDVN